MPATRDEEVSRVQVDHDVAPGRGHPSSSPPPLSVVMPVHNALPFLDASMRSILGQTFADFEFIVLDDGSTDGSAAALRAWARGDRRIRLFASQSKLGLVGSSNFVVARATAPIIARMDADDVAHPERLERQLAVLREHRDAQLVGTLWEGIDPHGRCIRPRDRGRLLRRSTFAPFPHGSIMFRREGFDRIGGYREACAFWEDLDLYLRLASIGRVFVLPEALYHYRLHPKGSRLVGHDGKIDGAIDLMYRCIAARRASHRYDTLLAAAGAGSAPAARRLTPYAFVSVNASRLWLGQSPAILGALLQRGALAPNRATALTLAWALWGAASPASLRWALRWWIRVGDWAASRRLPAGRPYEWRFA